MQGETAGSCQCHLILAKKGKDTELHRPSNNKPSAMQRNDESHTPRGYQHEREQVSASKSLWVKSANHATAVVFTPDPDVPPAVRLGSIGSLGSSSICRTRKLFSSVNWSSSVRSSRNLGRNLSRRSRLLMRIRCTATDLFGFATNTCATFQVNLVYPCGRAQGANHAKTIP